MKVDNMIRPAFYIPITALLIFFVGVLNLHYSDNNDHCSMTYMFEYPQFVRISFKGDNVQKQYPQYGLYAYSEGRHTEKTRKMWFDGIPVLFLPGNAGSHMQARSLASVALRKAISKGSEYHFDFFTINYNEELSGLYGGVLEGQATYAASSVLKILSLYKPNRYTKSVPKSVIIIGHSMGGVIAKSLLSHPDTMNCTNLIITLASPLLAPVVEFDLRMNNFYNSTALRWNAMLNENKKLRKKKIIISFASGPRDILVTPVLTSVDNNDTALNVLTTAVPGVWVSPDHVSMVWCKQLVMAINRYLFDIVDPKTQQITEKQEMLMSKARQYFEANRSMTLNPDIVRSDVILPADAFWYEDNRRSYQINRPDINRTTFLMIRLVKYPQNRFVAIETVNVPDKEWIFGCNAMFTHNTYRHCKQATPLTELSRWSGSANDTERRKLATVDLHSLMQDNPDWTHVVVRVSPTKKPVTINVDINDLQSRTVDVWPSVFHSNVVIIETEPNILYYELNILDFVNVHQAYLLYVKPTRSCREKQYHVTAELRVPWAKNHEYFHYFTNSKRSSMKLRLFKSRPTTGSIFPTLDGPKVLLLLDPKCTYTIIISPTWYLRLGQMVRNYTPILVPYIGVILLMALRGHMLSLRFDGTCISVPQAVVTQHGNFYFSIVFVIVIAILYPSLPAILRYELPMLYNQELLYYGYTVLIIATYTAAMGFVFIFYAVVLATVVFSSQLAHRFLLRILWRGGGDIAQNVTDGLRKVPLIGTMIMGVLNYHCGAAALTFGAVFYAFLVSKMYEDYLEDYVYKMMLNIYGKICKLLKSDKPKAKPKDKENANEDENKEDDKEGKDKENDGNDKDKDNKGKDKEKLNTSKGNENGDKGKEKDDEGKDKEKLNASKDKEKTDDGKDKEKLNASKEKDKKDKEKPTTTTKPKPSGPKPENKPIDEPINPIDKDLSRINYHMLMLLLWLYITAINFPALLTWARNYKHSMLLRPDTSYPIGYAMTLTSGFLWQMDVSQGLTYHHEILADFIVTLNLLVFTIGPFSYTVINYITTLMFCVIPLHQFIYKAYYTYF